MGRKLIDSENFINDQALESPRSMLIGEIFVPDKIIANENISQ